MSLFPGVVASNYIHYPGYSEDTLRCPHFPALLPQIISIIRDEVDSLTHYGVTLSRWCPSPQMSITMDDPRQRQLSSDGDGDNKMGSNNIDTTPTLQGPANKQTAVIAATSALCMNRDN